jgi:alpha-tubulin suppressor-like RCC1 family protein
MNMKPRSIRSAILLFPFLLLPLASCTDSTAPADTSSDEFQRTPLAVAGNLTATGVDAGYRFACAGTTSGAYCWGVAHYGALGSVTGGLDLAAPAPVTGGSGIVQLTARWGDACGLDADGVARCWGDNTYGEAGADSTVYWVYEARVVNTDVRFVRIATGKYQACGLTAGGALYCWGNGATLGAGDVFVPSQIHPNPERVLSDRTFVEVSGGQAHTCALDDTGTAWCWGRNRDGELGDGQTGPTVFVTTPQQVLGGHQFVSIAAGGFHACGVTAAGEAWCWGDNGFGQLGNGSGGAGQVAEVNEATPVAVAGGHAFTRLFGGYFHTCGLTSDGIAYCWGNDNTGQLGIGDQTPDRCGTEDCAWKPMAVAGDLVFSTLGAGSDVTCGVTTAGKLYCWGPKEALGAG